MVAATTAYRTQNAKMGCYQSGPTYRKEPRNSAISRCFWAFNYIYACIKDCVLIDPPYNTGNDFVYRDSFSSSLEEYESSSGIYDDSGNKLFKNTSANGRFHSDWCSMMYSRLLLSRNLLKDDGAIFISIDDNEQTNIKNLCNEVFGEENKVAEFVVIRAEGGGMAKQVIKGHDYFIFVFILEIRCIYHYVSYFL